MAGKIKMNFTGFEGLLEDIQKANGDLKLATETAMRQSANIMQSELSNAMTNKGVDSGLVERLPPPVIAWEANRCTAAIGYKKGSFDPNNLSDGYKVVFLNYGTPKIAPKLFITDAKKRGAPKVKKEQRKALEEILQNLRG